MNSVGRREGQVFYVAAIDGLDRVHKCALDGDRHVEQSRYLSGYGVRPEPLVDQRARPLPRRSRQMSLKAHAVHEATYSCGISV